jgi:hypothetical protein
MGREHHSLAIKARHFGHSPRRQDAPIFGFVAASGHDAEGSALPGSAARAAGMMINRFVAAALVLGSASLLGGCSPFSSSVADMWPHWAGGEPAGLPPRPGEPGYEQFIAHGQPNQNPPATQQTPTAPPAPADTTATIAEQKSIAPEQKPPAFAEPQGQDRSGTGPVPDPAEQPVNDSGVVRGGLY